MAHSSELDGIDFRPFFDMVVGILFVLLILIGALIFFQQAQESDAAATQSRIDDQRWHGEINGFIERVAAALRERGLPAQADPANGSVVFPLASLVDLKAPDLLPSLNGEAVGALGAVLEGSVSCVSVPRRDAGTCVDDDLLHLDLLAVEVRFGTLPPGAALPQDRAARLTANLLSGELLQGAIGLLNASNDAGSRIVSFDGMTTSAAPSPSVPVAGDIGLVFTFRDVAHAP